MAKAFFVDGFPVSPEVTMDRIMEAAEADDQRGFCTACGAEAHGVEPDARRYECAVCGGPFVYGAEELVIQLGSNL